MHLDGPQWSQLFLAIMLLVFIRRLPVTARGMVSREYRVNPSPLRQRWCVLLRCAREVVLDHAL